MKWRSKRRDRLGLALILILGISTVGILILAIAGLSPRQIGDALHATRADGSWKAVRLDGAAVTSKNYLVVVRRGRVVGGYDDCNGWSYEDKKPDEHGERRVLSTLVECAADEDLRQIYRTLVYAPKIDGLGENELRLSRGGHEGIFRRCKPDNQRFRCVEVR